MRGPEAINLVEVVLRSLIYEVLGDSWLEEPSVSVEDLESKQAAEQAKRRGVVTSTNLLDYLEFYQLKSIITRDQNWSKFEPALEKKKYFTLYMDRLEGFRNPAMHSRDLFVFEEHLVLGIVGEIKNQITKYRSSKGPDLKYFPEINAVTDITHGIQATTTNTRSGLTLVPGDQVQVRCAATDPEGRELSWSLRVIGPDFGALTVDQSVGDEVTLVWKVDGNHIRENQQLMIFMTSSGKYHRRGDHDEVWSIMYNVVPGIAPDLSAEQ